SSLLTPRAPRPTPSPYTTLFRSDQRGGGHLPLERDRQVDDDHYQEGDQRLQRLPGDLAAPAGADVLDADLVRRKVERAADRALQDRKSTRLNSSHEWISYAVFCL